jgi:simple sugar transport system permease protein
MTALARSLPSGRTLTRLVLCLVASVLVTSAVFAIAGADPLAAFEALVRGSLGNRLGVEQTFELAAILVLAGLAVAIPARAKLWNIGGEGQIFAGALAAVTVALEVDAPAAVLVVLALLAGLVAGALLAAVAGALRAFTGANEVLTTLMLNFVAMLFAYYAITHFFPAAGIRGSTPEVPAAAELPELDNDVTAGVLIALVCAAAAYVLLKRTRLGLQIRAAGANPEAAAHNGIDVPLVYVAAFALGGAFAGLAGAIVVLGIDGLLARDFSPGYGFIGIAVALLARSRPLWIVPAALLFSVVTVGGSYLETYVGLSADMALVIQGIFLLLLLAFWVLPPERGAVGRA